MLAVLLVALVSAAPVVPPPPRLAVDSIPDEPGAVVLPDSGQTLQAVAVDLDADAAPELLRLVTGDRDSVIAEAWGETRLGWRPFGRLAIVPEHDEGGDGDADYTGRPVRLLLRQVGGIDRATLVRQPRYAEPGVGAEDCCLLLHDLVLRDGELSEVPVADPAGAVGAVFVIDLDGDGTDELLTATSLVPLADVSYPTEARVYRWDGRSFGSPVVTELPVGSGDTPFILGDSDGLPGDEAAIISTAGRPALFRVRLGEGDVLGVEDLGFGVTDARAVPLDGGTGLAVIRPGLGLDLMRWPAGGEPGAAEANQPLDGGVLLGVVGSPDDPRLAVHEIDRARLHLLALRSLESAATTIVTPTQAATTIAGGPLAPYVGPIPGGDRDGAPAMIYAGRLLAAGVLVGASQGTPTATLAGAQPIGLVGADRAWLALLHAPVLHDPLDPAGGRLDPPTQRPAAVSLVPFELAHTPEEDAGAFAPSVERTMLLDGGELAVGADGFVATVNAPAGSHLYVGGAEPSTLGPGLVVPAGGQAQVVVAPPAGTTNFSYRPSLSVVTPAGHAYLAMWDVRVLVEPPPLVVTASTPFGSSQVEVIGRTAPDAELTMGGTPVAVGPDGAFQTSVELPPWPTEVTLVARDQLGNEAAFVVTGVGIVDYRSLPWVPISAALLGAVAAALIVRVPRVGDRTPRATDEGELEELQLD